MAGRVLIAPDKLRGSATAEQAADALGRGFEAAGWSVDRCPLSDGGEGFLAALGGGNRLSTVTDPLGRPLEVPWRSADGLAVIETALVSAPTLAASPTSEQAEAATSVGAGQLLAAAIEAGARTVLIGLGGSAFSDGGRGALAALEPVLPLPAEVVVAADVRTRYLDAATVYGPQKGADPAAVGRLSVRLAETAAELTRRFGRDPRAADGTGAAGGLAGLLWAAGAELRSGFDIVAERLQLDRRIAHADLIVTAEGRLDQTSFAGKVVGGLRDRAGGRPLWILAGAVAPELARADTVIDLSARYGRTRSMTDAAGCLADAVAELLARPSD